MDSAVERWFLLSGPRRVGDGPDAGWEHIRFLTGRVEHRAALAD